MRYKYLVISLVHISLSTNILFSQNTNRPKPRWGHSMVVIGNKFYIFGGQGNEGRVAKAMSGPTLNDLWAYNEDNSEYEIEPATDSPPARRNHAAYKKDGLPWFNIHGGYGEQGPLDDMYSYMPSDGGGSWGGIGIINVPPEYVARYSHTMNEINDQRYILGGLDGNSEPLSDFWQYGVQDGQVRFTPLADFPKRIAGHATITVDDDHLLVFGGGIPGMNTFYNDAYLYTVSTNTWDKLTATKEPLPPVYGFACTQSSDAHIWLYGGLTPDGINSNLYEIDTDNLENQCLIVNSHTSPFEIAAFGFEPTMVSNKPHQGQSTQKTAETDKEYLYLFGGMNEDSVATNHMLRYDILLDQWAELTDEGWQDIGTGIDGAPDSPSGFILNQNYPNPFNSETQIQYTLSCRTHVRLQILDIQGIIIKTLVNEIQDLGIHTCSYQADYLPSGIYMIRLQVENQQWIRKALLTK